MKIRVYYDDIDGNLNPQWILLPIQNKETAAYSIDAPFERFWPEDFHDSLAVLTVTQAALLRDQSNLRNFSIFIPRVLEDLTSASSNNSLLHEAEYFLVRLDDLEEVMKMDVRRCFIN
ncbi:hypothetical protein GN156_00495 [bacterium LRH843]|nr:hypothetical protein [bacterium LRH843]